MACGPLSGRPGGPTAGAQVPAPHPHVVGAPAPGPRGRGLHTHLGKQAGLEADDALSHLVVHNFHHRCGSLGGLLLYRPGCHHGHHLLLHHGGGGGRGGLFLHHRGLIGGLVGELYLGGHRTDAQKAGLASLQNLQRHIVPVQTQLGQTLGNGLVLILAGYFNKLQHDGALLP